MSASERKQRRFSGCNSSWPRPGRHGKAKLSVTCAVRKPQGQTWRYPLWRQMYHVVNHSSYHRGQLTTMLRQLAARPIPMDFLVFHDELESHTA